MSDSTTPACGRYALAVADVAVRPVAGVARRSADRRRRPADQQHRRRHQLRDARARPADARVRRRAPRGPEIRVRRARPGETLDARRQTRTLDETMLVIADREHAVALAGVMGGARLGGRRPRRGIALESAWFLPASVRATSKRLGLKTEASARFERGADVDGPVRALRRALALLAGDRRRHSRGAPIVDVYPAPRPLAAGPRCGARASPGCSAGRARRRCRADPHRAGVRRGRDGRRVGRRLAVTVPSFRVDVAREADLIEEVGRHWGFDRMPATFPALAAPQPRRRRRSRATGSPAGPHAARVLGGGDVHVHRAEPRRAVLRAGRRGSRDRQPAVREIRRPPAVAAAGPGRCAASTTGGASGRTSGCSRRAAASRRRGEGRAVAFVWCGAADGPHWCGALARRRLLRREGHRRGHLRRRRDRGATSSRAGPWFLVPRPRRRGARGATRRYSASSVRFAPAIVDARGFPAAEDVFAGELDLGALADGEREQRPARRLAAALPVDRARHLDARRRHLACRRRSWHDPITAPSTLVAIGEFDRYQGKGVPDGRVSLSLRLTFRAPDRTLTDDEVQSATVRIIEALRAAHGAERR